MNVGNEEKKHHRHFLKYADDDKYPVSTLALMRLPPLIIGLFFGIGLSFVTSRFEEVLSEHIELAYFIPLIVYMADAIGTQTQSIYVRDLRSGHAHLRNYLLKEIPLGVIFGLIFGIASWFIVSLWIGTPEIARTVGLAMFVATATAPLVALIVTEAFELEHQDPAVGAGPVATVIQDAISVIIYGLIASAIIFA